MVGAAFHRRPRRQDGGAAVTSVWREYPLRTRKCRLRTFKRDIHLLDRGISTCSQRGYPLARKGDIHFCAKGISLFARGGYPLGTKGDIPFAHDEGETSRNLS